MTPQLGQPRGYLTGYLGARHAQIMRRLPRSNSLLIAELRCARHDHRSAISGHPRVLAHASLL
jgi:hypothetical protein